MGRDCRIIVRWSFRGVVGRNRGGIRGRWWRWRNIDGIIVILYSLFLILSIFFIILYMFDLFFISDINFSNLYNENEANQTLSYSHSHSHGRLIILSSFLISLRFLHKIIHLRPKININIYITYLPYFGL